ncbi:hypothetical protein MKX01_013785 [Papaver californicum]|nr:hypothetical protein MKX01_013785 [Papaver californicum]
MSGTQCYENLPTLSSSSGNGCVQQLGGLQTYVCGSLDSKFGILFVSDIFGYEAPNLRNLADKVAAAGFYVVVPDFLHGDPYVPENAEKPLPIWIKSHGTDKGAEETKPVMETLKTKVVGELGKSDDLKAIVMAHPSFFTVDDIKEIKVPISILGVEIDEMSPPELLKQFKEVFSTKTEVDSFVKIFPGVSHGWTVRYNNEDEADVKPVEEAHKDMLEWFTKYVK